MDAENILQCFYLKA